MIKILIADDDRDDVEIFTAALQLVPLQTELEVVRDGGALLDRLCDDDKPKPDFLFLDLAMPKKTGFECLNHVRQNCDYDDIRIIILSDSINVGEIDDAYDMGANYFLTKPADLNEFGELLTNILSNPVVRAASRAEFLQMNNFQRRRDRNLPV